MYAIFDTDAQNVMGYTDYPEQDFGRDSIVAVELPPMWDEAYRDHAVLIDGKLTIQVASFALLKAGSIKAAATSQIDAMAWRLDRARERDTIGAEGETVTEVLTARESIRRAASRAEAEVMQLTTADEVAGYSWEVTPADIPVPTRMTIYAFLRRFTNDEAVAIDLASYGETAEAAGVRRYTSLVTNARTIDLSLAELRDGVNALEATGILAEGRATEILDTPIGRTKAPI